MFPTKIDTDTKGKLTKISRRSSPRRSEISELKSAMNLSWGPVVLFSSTSKSNTQVTDELRKRWSTHQLIENWYIVWVGQERSIALRCRGERRSIHSGEDVGECAGRTELCPGPGIAGDPLALRRVYRSDVLISQLRERHGGGKRGNKSAAITQSKGIAAISTFTVRACERQKVQAREVYISSGTASVNDPVAPLISSSSSSFHPHFPIDLDGLRSGPYRLL